MALPASLNVSENSNSTWTSQLVGAGLPSEISHSAMASVFRPFGNLPGKALPRDECAAITGFASAVAALCIALALFLTVRIIRNRTALSERNVRQVPIFTMLAISCLFMVMCLISIADAATQYPDPQSLWGQAFSGFGYIGLVTCTLTPLFYKPLGSHDDKASHIKDMGVMGINVVTVVVLCTLEVVVISLNVMVPRALLLSIFIVKMVILTIYTLVGTFSLTDAKFQQLKSVDKDAPSLGESLMDPPLDGRRITGGIAVGRRMMALAPGLFFTFLYTLTDSFESPVLMMRGFGIMCIFALMVINLLISWSIFMTIMNKGLASRNANAQDGTIDETTGQKRLVYTFNNQNPSENEVNLPSSSEYGTMHRRG